MKMLSIGAMFAAISFLSVGVASAQPAASFRFGGIQFATPLPDGYCLPQGTDIEVAQLTAAIDDQNVTHLTLYPCQAQDGLRLDYILIKTPTAALTASVTREQFLEGMGEAFNDGPLTSALASGEFLDRIEDRTSSMLGRNIDLTGGIRPLGRDGVCAYLGGTAQVSSGNMSYSISVGTCITVVSNRILTVNWYGPDRGSNGIAELLARSRRLAEQIQAGPAT